MSIDYAALATDQNASRRYSFQPHEISTAYRSTSSQPKVTTYRIKRERNKMQLSGIEKIIGAMYAIILALLGAWWHSLSSDIDNIKTKIDANTSAINETKIELVKAVGGMEKQQELTNQKLELLIDKLPKSQRP